MTGPEWTGVVGYVDHAPGDSAPRVVVTIGVGVARLPVQAILDTGGAWDVLDPALARACGLVPSDDDEQVALMVRGGSWSGRLVRGTVVLFAEDGDDLVVEGTWFVPDEADLPWKSPNFMGYGGTLSRITFAIDPGSRRVWFAPLASGSTQSTG